MFKGSIIMIGYLLLISGCTGFQKSPIPKVSEKTIDDPIPISEVMKEIRKQVYSAYQYVPYLKKAYEENEASQGLNPQRGSGSFSGQVQLVKTNEGDVMATIPFSGYVGSTLIPRFDINRTDTTIQNTSLNFSVDPRAKTLQNENWDEGVWEQNKCDTKTQDELERDVTCQNLKEEYMCFGQDKVDVLCEFQKAKLEKVKNSELNLDEQPITRALFNVFKGIAKIENSLNNDASGNYLSINTISEIVELSFTFAVARTKERGVAINFVPTGDISPITGNTPLLGSSSTRTGTYTLEFTIPLVTPQSNNSNRLISGLINNNPVVLIDRPFIDTKAKKLRDSLKDFLENNASSSLVPLVDTFAVDKNNTNNSFSLIPSNVSKEAIRKLQKKEEEKAKDVIKMFLEQNIDKEFRF